MFFCQLYLTDSKTLKQSASINPEILASFAFEDVTLFDFLGDILNDCIDSLFINQANVVFIPGGFVLGFEFLHILTSFHEFFLVLSQTF